MSFQLIYTSAEHLLDSSVSGYGTVARSEALSKTLRARLSAISVYREPRPAAAPQGPQFSYHLIDHAGTTSRQELITAAEAALLPTIWSCPRRKSGSFLRVNCGPLLRASCSHCNIADSGAAAGKVRPHSSKENRSFLLPICRMPLPSPPGNA